MTRPVQFKCEETRNFWIQDILTLIQIFLVILCDGGEYFI
jgi:hypothetical protein